MKPNMMFFHVLQDRGWLQRSGSYGYNYLHDVNLDVPAVKVFEGYHLLKEYIFLKVGG